MTSPTAAALSAANQISRTGATVLTTRFLTWINAQASPALAAAALESVQETTKSPDRMLLNAAAALAQITGAGDDIGGGSAGPATYVDLGSKTGAVAIDPTKDLTAIQLTGDVTATVAAGANGRSFAVWVVPNGHTITIDGHACALTAAGMVVVTRSLGVWQVQAPAAAGGAGSSELDTGWRSHNSYLVPFLDVGAHPERSFVRRKGDRVWLHIEADIKGGQGNVENVFPTGWRYSIPGMPGVQDWFILSGPFGVNGRVRIAGGQWNMTTDSNQLVTVNTTLSYVTADPFPDQADWLGVPTFSQDVAV